MFGGTRTIVCVTCQKDITVNNHKRHETACQGITKPKIRGIDFDPNAGFKNGSRRQWNTGLTKATDIRVSSKSKGRRRITDAQRIDKMLYFEQCNFSLVDLDKIEGYELLVQHRMYNRRTNPNGVVRDHKVSKDYGYKNKIDPAMISHPANCQFITHKDNARKGYRCSITVEELLRQKIKDW